MLPNSPFARTTLTPPRTADQRGYTLQTLIVTAVVVVVAVIVTVVLIAITSNANEDLAASDSDMKSRCGPGEIFDPELHAAGHGSVAAHGGIKSSAIGCWQFCYIESNELFGLLNKAENFRFPEQVIETPGTDGNRTNTWWLRHSTEKTNQHTRNHSNIVDKPADNIIGLRTSEGVRFTVLPVVGPYHADSAIRNDRANEPVEPGPLALVEPSLNLRGRENYSQRPYEIGVHPSNEYCVVRNADTGETVFRSTELRPTSEHASEAGATTAPNGEAICRPRRDTTLQTGTCEISGTDGTG